MLFNKNHWEPCYCGGQSARFAVTGVSSKNPVLVDLLARIVYEIPKENISNRRKTTKVSEFPVANYPLVIVNKELLTTVGCFIKIIYYELNNKIY